MERTTLKMGDKEEVFEGETLAEAQAKRSAYIKELRRVYKEKHANDKETPAKGKRGFLLYSPFAKRHFFRVYNWQDEELCERLRESPEPINWYGFKDYTVCAEDVEVEILCGGLSLYENEHGEHRLDWCSRTLDKPEK